MQISGVAKKAFLAGLGIGLVAAAAPPARAWFRTVSYMQPLGQPDIAVELPITSDGTTGTPNGNSTTSIYGDYYWVQLGAGKSLSVSLQACSIAFTSTGGSCGTTTTGTYTTASGNADVAGIPKWVGTNSVWDYFWVTAYISATTGTPGVYFMGVGITGT